MKTLICYTSDSHAYVEWLEQGRPATKPSDVPFWLPKETQKGDRFLLYVGGQDQTYVGWGTIESNWRDGTRGWKGQEIVQTTDHMLREPVTGADVLAATGFKPPRIEKVIDENLASAVWRAARGKTLSPLDRAVEGILTESRSRSRNAGLRLAAIQRAAGVCEGCGVNYGRKHGGLGKNCLVVHHKIQIKDTDQPRETKLSELAVVCANCHMMIHSNRMKALTLTQLRKKIGNT
jgi:hypothetical protein